MKLDADILALETFDLKLGGVEYNIKQIDAEQYAAAITAQAALATIKVDDPIEQVKGAVRALSAWAPSIPEDKLHELTMRQLLVILTAISNWQQDIKPGDLGNVGGG